MTEQANITALPIPAKYAGMKLDKVKPHIKIDNQEFVGSSSKSQLEVVTIEGQRYSLQNGYLVPFYIAPQGEFARRAEELTLDRARRFFYTAQPEIDVRWTKKDIEASYQDYLACTDPDLKAIKAPFLVGEIINRMERLARVYFQANTEGAEIELTEEQLEGLEAAQTALADLKTLKRLRPSNKNDKDADEHYEAMQRPIIQKIKTALTPIKAEVDSYVHLLNFGAPEIVEYVRLRNKAPDNDWHLADLIREMTKVWGVENTTAENTARNAILQKIGHTMEAIDETHDILRQLLENPTAMTSLRNAKTAYVDSLSPERTAIRELLEGGSQKVLDEYAQVCRARTGIKSEDADNFMAVRERAALIDLAVHEVHKNLRAIGRSTKQSDISELRDMLSDGFQLMTDMAQTRMPKNHNAPAPTDRNKEKRSVELLRERALKWLDEHKEQGYAPSKT